MENKYWKVLLEDWRKKGRNGFTIPFIIGSQKFLNEWEQLQSVSDLILDIVNNKDAVIYITYCTDLNDLILGIRDKSKQNIVGKFPTYKGVAQSNFYLTKIAYDLGENIEDIIVSLTEQYKFRLAHKEYSVNNRKGGDYNTREVEFINNSFKKIQKRTAPNN